MTDISIVLNCHDEDKYIEATLKSLDLCIQEAVCSNLTVELICVLDSATTKLSEKIQDFQFKSLVLLKVIHVTNASLGLSRNDGIKVCTGNFICTADADDLISSNWLLACFQTAQNYFSETKKHCIVVSEFIYSFGNSVSLQKYFASRYFSPCDVIAYNPFSSRVFAHRTIFEKLMYQNLNKNSGFAYEDWDFNVRSYFLGIEFITAPQTILFYRRRDNSIMTQSDYVKLIPYSELYEPKILIERATNYTRPLDFKKLASSNVRHYAQSKFFIQSITQMNEIDPSVNLKNEIFTKNTDLVWHHYGYDLLNLFQKTEGLQFSCVIYLEESVSQQTVNLLKNFINLNQRYFASGEVLLLADFATNIFNSIFGKIPIVELSSFSKNLSKTTRDLFNTRVLLSLVKDKGCLIVESEDSAYIGHYKKALLSRAKVLKLSEFISQLGLHQQSFISCDRENVGIWKLPVVSDEKTKYIIPYIVKNLSSFPTLYIRLKNLYRSYYVQKLIRFLFRREFE